MSLLLARLPADLLLAYLEGHAPLGFVLLDSGGRLKQWSDGFQRLLGDLPLELGLPVSSLLDSDSGATPQLPAPGADPAGALTHATALQWTCWRPGRNQVETRCRTIAVDSDVLLIVEPVCPEDAEHPEVNERLANQARELEEAYAAIEALTRTDALTGLPNRRHLFEKLEDEVARSARHGTALSVARVDVDRFGAVDERHGPGTVEQILKTAGFLFDTLLRNVDTAGRLGHEEFLVLLPYTSLTDAQMVAERLRGGLAAEKIEGLEEPVTLSAGLAGFRAGDSATSLVNRAGEALNRARVAGGDRVEAAE